MLSASPCQEQNDDSTPLRVVLSDWLNHQNQESKRVLAINFPCHQSPSSRSRGLVALERQQKTRMALELQQKNTSLRGPCQGGSWSSILCYVVATGMLSQSDKEYFDVYAGGWPLGNVSDLSEAIAVQT